MVVELLRPSVARPATGSIHPPTKRAPKRPEPTSALQFARDLADADSPNDAQLATLAELVAVQLPQGPLAERLQIYFAIGELFGKEFRTSAATESIVATMLDEIRPLVAAIAPTLRWTALASLASILDRPYFSATSRRIGAGYLCTLIAPAIDAALPQDKAVVYSLLAEMTRCGYVTQRNSWRILANVAKNLRPAIREKSLSVRRQLLEQHVALLESGTVREPEIVASIQVIINEHADDVAAAYSETARDFFLRSVRRALI